MKKSVFNLTVISLLAFSIISCDKSSVNKISNKWTVTSFSESSKTDFGKNSTVEYTSNSILYTDTYDWGVVNYGGVLVENTFTIYKDGMWESKKDFTIVDNNGVNNLVTQTKVTESGTWSFLKPKNKADFKKNERVIFNTLSSTKIQYITPTSGGGPTDTSSTSTTFQSGTPSITYIIKESSDKKLIFSYFDSFTPSENTSAAHIYKSDMVLEQK